MPRITIQHSGKSTGTKTVLVNLQEVCSSLKRDPLHLLKFISYDLATQTKVDNKKFIVNGKHDGNRIQECIFDYIDLFVLCSKCENPETFYVDDGGLAKECLACGEKTKVPAHKLNATIMRDLDKQDYNNMYTKFTTEEVDLKDVLENSERVYEALKVQGIPEERMLPTVLNYGESYISKCGEIVRNVDSKVLFASVDEFIESSKKVSLLPLILNFFKECGKKKNELFKFFSRPQNNKKRSLEYKSEVNKYFSN